ncbi:hypothetical protein [Thalassoporum mexicanum]|uniref:hypothetical protein n=1 Tax=Thalassoporum mexicanum TaxID=3457544 RepID=UPI0002D91B91|nr:hypothetical protein [Pseudanabaena sp. PCC 7367]
MPIDWTIAGLFLLRFVPDVVPRILGRSLYWVGVPLQILAFTLRTELDRSLWLVPAVVIAALIASIGIAWGFSWRLPVEDKGSYGFGVAIDYQNTNHLGVCTGNVFAAKSNSANLKH